MKTLRNVLGLLALSLSFAANADSSVVCDHSLKATSPLFQNALNNLYSFEYIHHAMESILQAAGPQDVVFCTSSIAVDKNIYQYLEHIVSIDVYVAKAQDRSELAAGATGLRIFEGESAVRSAVCSCGHR